MKENNWDARSLEISLRCLFPETMDIQTSAMKFFQGTGIVKEHPFWAIMCGLIAVMIEYPSKDQEIIAFMEKYIDEKSPSFDLMTEDYEKIIQSLKNS